LCGISKSMFFRLWTRAPRTVILSFDMAPGFTPPATAAGGRRALAAFQERLEPDGQTSDYKLS